MPLFSNRMRVAIVSQPVDSILPPFQTSAGVCTYGMARTLANFCEVSVYGIRERNRFAPGADAAHIRFRFLPSTLRDRVAFKTYRRWAALKSNSLPVSASRCFYPDFGEHVARHLAAERPDVIHVQHCWQYLPAIRASNPHAKLLLRIDAECFTKVHRQPFEECLQCADLITSVSGFVTARMRRCFPSVANRCQTTYNGIDPADFVPEKRRNLGHCRKEKVILYAGAISPLRGIHVLLESFCQVLRRFPDVRLQIVGSTGNYPICQMFDNGDREVVDEVGKFNWMKRPLLSSRPAQEAYLSYLQDSLPPQVIDKVHFSSAASRSELIRHYYDADVFAFPSICNEGFGLPAVEAMAAGLPVVASRSGATVETVRDGETGFLVGKSDPSGLAGALLRLLQNDGLREAMGQTARERALSCFSWDRIAHSLFLRYQNLCAETGSSKTSVNTSAPPREKPRRTGIWGLLKESYFSHRYMKTN